MTNTDDIVLPRKSVDDDVSLEERLTDNIRFGAGPARYFLDGEDWSDVFHRVARNVALGDLVHIAGRPSSFPQELIRDRARDRFHGDSVALTESALPYVDTEALYDHLEADYPAVHETLTETADTFERMMRQQRFMPNSPALMNAGGTLQQLSACFTASPGDAMVNGDDIDRESIMQAASDAAAIFKSGGGVGYAFHHLRPKGAHIGSTEGVSSGPLSFMQIYDTVCLSVSQGGKRRGAQMGIMHVQHPDIGRFMLAKRGEDNLTNFNLSAGLTDAFIDAVENDELLTLYDPEVGFQPTDDPQPFSVVAESAHFFDPAFEDAWNDKFDKPGMGLDGKPVHENFWRDYQDEMSDPDAFDVFREDLDLELGAPLRVPARFLWQILVDGAHNNGEPGFVYLDEINREHSFDVEEHPDHYIHSTNPCSEQPLENYEACNLGHVNLSLLLTEDAPTYDAWLTDKFDDIEFDDYRHTSLVHEYVNEALDQQAFEQVVDMGTRFLDNVVTMSRFPDEVPQTSEEVGKKRKIGLGLMGFHQLAIQMGIRYGSSAGQALAGTIMQRIDARATQTSHELSDTRGVFPQYEESKWAAPTEYPDWFQKHAHLSAEAHADGYRMRNHNVTTIAPTGTTSMIGDTTAGCEPIFSVAFFKNVGDDIQGDEMLVEFDDYFLRVLEANDIDVEAVKTEAVDQMQNNEFDGIEGLSQVPDALGDIFVTAGALTPAQHVDMQSAFQNHVDSAISKTINLPNEATIGAVGDAILLALNRGIKGATVYRDGSRQEQVKTTRMDNELESASVDALAAELAETYDSETLSALVDALSPETPTAGGDTPAPADD